MKTWCRISYVHVVLLHRYQIIVEKTYEIRRSERSQNISCTFHRWKKKSKAVILWDLLIHTFRNSERCNPLSDRKKMHANIGWPESWSWQKKISSKRYRPTSKMNGSAHQMSYRKKNLTKNDALPSDIFFDALTIKKIHNNFIWEGRKCIRWMGGKQKNRLKFSMCSGFQIVVHVSIYWKVWPKHPTTMPTPTSFFFNRSLLYALRYCYCSMLGIRNNSSTSCLAAKIETNRSRTVCAAAAMAVVVVGDEIVMFMKVVKRFCKQLWDDSSIGRISCRCALNISITSSTHTYISSHSLDYHPPLPIPHIRQSRVEQKAVCSGDLRYTVFFCSPFFCRILLKKFHLERFICILYFFVPSLLLFRCEMRKFWIDKRILWHKCATHTHTHN